MEIAIIVPHGPAPPRRTGGRAARFDRLPTDPCPLASVSVIVCAAAGAAAAASAV